MDTTVDTDISFSDCRIPFEIVEYFGTGRINLLLHCCTMCKIDHQSLISLLREEYNEMCILSEHHSIIYCSKLDQEKHMERFVTSRAVYFILECYFRQLHPKYYLNTGSQLLIKDSSRDKEHGAVVEKYIQDWEQTVGKFVDVLNKCSSDLKTYCFVGEICGLLFLQSKLCITICDFLPSDKGPAEYIGKAIHCAERILEEIDLHQDHLYTYFYDFSFGKTALNNRCFTPLLDPWLRDRYEYKHKIEDHISTAAHQPAFQNAHISSLLDIEMHGIWKFKISLKKNEKGLENSDIYLGKENKNCRKEHHHSDNSPSIYPRSSFSRIWDVTEEFLSGLHERKRVSFSSSENSRCVYPKIDKMGLLMKFSEIQEFSNLENNLKLDDSKDFEEVDLKSSVIRCSNVLNLPFGCHTSTLDYHVSGESVVTSNRLTDLSCKHSTETSESDVKI